MSACDPQETSAARIAAAQTDQSPLFRRPDLIGCTRGGIDAVKSLNLEIAHRMSAERPGTPKLITYPLPIGGRSALAAALKNSQLPIEDIEAPGRLFWRFETVDNVSVGFGGLELYAEDALLRSIVALPPVRRKGFGSAIVAELAAAFYSFMS